MTRLFSYAQAARFYDLLGAGLDTQSFYETAALQDLVAHLQLARCESVVEFGNGTGRLAAELLSVHLPADATYLGLDVSPNMVRLATKRLRPFGARANVVRTDGTPHIGAADGTFDTFVSTYVFDLLSDDDARAVVNEARRVLKLDGSLGLVSLTDGPSLLSRLVTATWRGLHSVSPWLVGGCSGHAAELSFRLGVARPVSEHHCSFRCTLGSDRGTPRALEGPTEHTPDGCGAVRLEAAPVA